MTKEESNKKAKVDMQLQAAMNERFHSQFIRSRAFTLLLLINCRYFISDCNIGGINELVSRLKRLCSVRWPVTILGDFNCPDINWAVFLLTM